MKDPIHAVVLRAADLKVSAPEAYDAFVKSIADYEFYLKDQLMAAEPNVIFSMQGRTQQISYIRRKLEDCMRLRDDLLKARRTPDGSKV